MSVYFDVRSQVASIAERWRSQYENGGKWGATVHGNTHVAYQRLLALPEPATAADVAAVIGNDSWIGGRCNECDEVVDEFMQIGEEPDYESCTANICRQCFMKALAKWPADS